MDRRQLLKFSAASIAATALSRGIRAQAAPSPVRFTVGHKTVCTMPSDFTGLSYESPQLANPGFFAADNKDLVALFRELSPNGVLRTGGNLSAFTGWRDDPAVPLTEAEQAMLNKGKHYWEWDLTDPTIRNGDHKAIFTPASIETLASFLNATGWKLIYGLNFANGTIEQACAEAACVMRLCGKNLTAFQLGNEVEFWNGGFRPKPWDFDTYYLEWKRWTTAIRKAVPNAPLGGPDTASNLKWMEELAENEGNKLAVLTKHHYAMGPAGDPKMDAHHLLGPDLDVQKEIESAQRAKAISGVGFRTAECGSCYHGGQPGVSNAFASALWAADYMLTLAQGGHAGMNMHGGGEGRYSAITGDSVNGFMRKPIYFGMKLAQQFAGSTLLESKLNTGSLNVTGYAARNDHGILAALINKDASPIAVTVAGDAVSKAGPYEVWKLSAPSLDSQTGVSFSKDEQAAISVRSNPREPIVLAPYTALVVHYA